MQAPGVGRHRPRAAARRGSVHLHGDDIDSPAKLGSTTTRPTVPLLDGEAETPMKRGPSGWWLGANRTWHKGSPPRGWSQGPDGRWFDPADLPTERMAAVGDGPDRGRRAARARREGLEAAPWIRIAALALVAAVALSAAGLLALSFDTGPGDDSPSEHAGHSATSDASRTADAVSSGSAPSTSAADPSTTATPTTGAATTSPETDRASATAPTTASSSTDPLALCSQAQRMIIQRGNHPWSWYVDRFDRDRDGIFCE